MRSKETATDGDVHLADEWQNLEEVPNQTLSWQIPNQESPSTPIQENEGSPPFATSFEENNGASSSATSSTTADGTPSQNVLSHDGDNSDSPPAVNVPLYAPIDFSKISFRRSKRDSRPVQRLNVCTMLGFVTVALLTTVVFGTSVVWSSASNLFLNTIRFQHCLFSIGDSICNTASPLSFATTMADNDTLTRGQAKKIEDWTMFVAAMQKEMTGHEDEDDPHWDVIPASQMKSVTIKPVSVHAVWAFKRKRDPLGNITKHKA